MTSRQPLAGFDPRSYQIASLTLLFAYGLIWLDFDIPLLQAVVTLAICLGTQLMCSRLAGLPRIDLKSALISGLSLCLLLRTNHLVVAVAGSLIAIGSKFLLRWDGRHIFNPTNLALVLLLILTPNHVWVSPAQWGNFAFFAFLMACVGGLVVNRAARWDVTLAFLGFYTALVFARSLWLNEPLSIPLHKLRNGGLLLFAFFMISDPRTTPDSRGARVLFAFLVAFGAAWIQFRLFRNNGLLWSLALFSILVPLLNRLFPGAKYEWSSPRNSKNKNYETQSAPAEQPAGLLVPSR